MKQRRNKSPLCLKQASASNPPQSRRDWLITSFWLYWRLHFSRSPSSSFTIFSPFCFSFPQFISLTLVTMADPSQFQGKVVEALEIVKTILDTTRFVSCVLCISFFIIFMSSHSQSSSIRCWRSPQIRWQVPPTRRSHSPHFKVLACRGTHCYGSRIHVECSRSPRSEWQVFGPPQRLGKGPQRHSALQSIRDVHFR